MMMNHPVKHAARLNTEGVILLNEGGADQNSAKALTEALSIMQSQLIKRADDIDSDNNKNNTASDDSSLFSFEFGDCIPMMSSSSSSHFIFNRGVYFDQKQDKKRKQSNDNDIATESSSSSSPSSSSLHMYSAAIIFNLALLYHKRGLQYNNATCFRKADDLYRKITMILGWPTCDHCTLPPPAIIILTAAINNMCHIRHEQGHYELAEEGLRALSYILQTTTMPTMITTTTTTTATTSSTTTTTTTTTTLQQQVEGYFPASADFWNQIVLNCLLLKQPSLAAAA